MVEAKAECPRCGGPALLITPAAYLGAGARGDSLRCPQCDDLTGTFGELKVRLAWDDKRRMEERADGFLREVIQFLRDDNDCREAGGFSVEGLEALRTRLKKLSGKDPEQVFVATIPQIAEWLRGSPKSDQITTSTGEIVKLPIVRTSPQTASIEWQGVQHPVSHGWAEAFQMMIDAKGKPAS